MTELSITRGENATFLATCYQPPAIDGTRERMPLGTVTLEFRGARNHRDATAWFSKTVGSGITVTDAQNGEITIELDPADSNTLPNRMTQLVWELRATDVQNHVEVLADGELWVRPEVAP